MRKQKNDSKLPLIVLMAALNSGGISGISIQTCTAAELKDAHETLAATESVREKDTGDKLQARIESAEDIIEDAKNLQRRVHMFHQHATELIAQSKRLQGEAEVLTTKTPVLPPTTVKMTPAQLQAAVKQYSSDLEQFATHATAYDQHLRNFQATVGECHANESALNSVLKKYEIHVDQFHIPAINVPRTAATSVTPSLNTLRPPHVCKRMQEEMGDMSQLANSMLSDQKKVLDAQLALAKTEGSLKNAESEADASRLKATNEAKREQGEQALVREFSQLKNEYDLLKVEKDTLAGAGGLGKVTNSSVSAKIKKN
ncbi:MAG TPA: hypothetical protein V6C97_35785 [Oculatellaceae cyanobacterium]